ncbi:hypothetical protein, unlikely [Trypanosoma brucei gambiense DAL972]|uniref:Uncharacterized protein n=1 Tax=Trypanosoma brucei gambiense (strain MHOM/CI/86/DAL972) TaxID=679716 RepID=C9ZIZ3_TRYB9|nr:hypothetical protein, unlikely [Trypanosoma brucei gambiense DAL972]CBH09351.1 hypothetical protein, unlikely [Trypanosoma brucei gambiense DAL972]|eukprot:XP_011771657.1 hypothetical protein, unlikely [Trypanosoma brucei gambiense DAL972]
MCARMCIDFKFPSLLPYFFLFSPFLFLFNSWQPTCLRRIKFLFSFFFLRTNVWWRLREPKKKETKLKKFPQQHTSKEVRNATKIITIIVVKKKQQENKRKKKRGGECMRISVCVCVGGGGGLGCFFKEKLFSLCIF